MVRRVAMLMSGALVMFTAGVPFCVLSSEQPSGLVLTASAEVDSEGVLLSHVAKLPGQEALPVISLGEAPAFGKALVLTRADISNALFKAAPELAGQPLLGAEKVRITRRSAIFDEESLKAMLAAVLQRDHVKDRGDLELRLSRAWTAVRVPDEPLTLKILDLPTAGVTPSFIVRFELRTARETVGTWQTAVQARVLREVWVTREALRRGQPLTEASLDRQRRDVLTVREPLFDWTDPAIQLDVAESLQAGATVFARSARPHPVVRRGQIADAVLLDGSLSVSLKVEVLEDGAPGELIRARNPQTRRELRGKVIHESLLAISI
jgi:flagella basal body P-ring formation protein FlgA